MTQIPFDQLMKLDCHPVEKIWGHHRLAKFKKLSMRANTKKIGETWEISLLPEGPSYFQGEPLHSYVGEHLDYFWGPSQTLPYLIKFIDTSDYLSVQVHPNDDMAKKLENNERACGKTECWIILKAQKNAGVYLGLKEGVSKNSLKEVLLRSEDLSLYLNFIPVKSGDFFYVPAGTIHAIGKGVFLLEIQQSSGLTYRLWDWNRFDEKGNPRTIHIEKALAASNFHERDNQRDCFLIKHQIFKSPSNFKNPLIDHQDFKVSVFHLNQSQVLAINLEQRKRSSSIVIIEGFLNVSRGGHGHILEKGDSLLIPFGGGTDLKMVTQNNTCTFIYVE